VLVVVVWLVTVVVPVDVRTCVVSTVEVDGPIVTVVGTTTVLVEISVAV
jgi:hypothetical protein